jgi:hypothetical protein
MFQKTRADGVYDKCHARLRETEKPKLGEDIPSHEADNVDFGVKNGNNSNRISIG